MKRLEENTTLSHSQGLTFLALDVKVPGMFVWERFKPMGGDEQLWEDAACSRSLGGWGGFNSVCERAGTELLPSFRTPIPLTQS